jgi:hypothetical protein
MQHTFGYHLLNPAIRLPKAAMFHPKSRNASPPKAAMLYTKSRGPYWVKHCGFGGKALRLFMGEKSSVF